MSNPNKGIFVVLFGPGLAEEALSSKELVPSAALHTQVMKSNKLFAGRDFEQMPKI
jgi:hypothetical protein